MAADSNLFLVGQSGTFWDIRPATPFPSVAFRCFSFRRPISRAGATFWRGLARNVPGPFPVFRGCPERKWKSRFFSKTLIRRAVGGPVPTLRGRARTQRHGGETQRTSGSGEGGH